MRIGIPVTLLVALLAGWPAAAQDIQFTSYADVQTAYHVQNQQISNLHTRLASLETYGDGAASNGASCGGDCCATNCDPCGRSCGIVGGAELLFLKPYRSQGMYASGDEYPVGFDMETSPRFWLGFAGKRGLGFRARWWEFDHAATADVTYDDPVQDGLAKIALDIAVIDAEVTLASKVGYNWDMLFSAGVRHVDFTVVRSIDWEVWNDDLDSFKFGGTGLTVCGELRRKVFGSLNVFGNVRGSAVYGDATTQYGSNAPRTLPDFVGYIWETQLGVECSRMMPAGGMLFLRAAVEAQQWDEFASRGDAAFGFIGGIVSGGIMR